MSTSQAAPLQTRAGSLAQTFPVDLLWAVYLEIAGSQDLPHLPFVFSHVCHWWRGFAVQSPNLWSTIRFTSQSGALDRAALCLERSKQSLLTIRMTHKPFLKASVKTLSRILRLILPHARRWKALYLRGLIPPKILYMIFYRLRYVALESLEVFFISTDYPNVSKYGRPITWQGYAQEPAPLKLDAPRLRSITTWDSLIVIRSLTKMDSITILRISGIRHFGYPGNLDDEPLNDLLATLPNLQFLEVAHRPHSRICHTTPRRGLVIPFNLAPQRLVHRSLRVLDNTVRERSVDAVLMKWSLPNLQWLPRYLFPVKFFEHQAIKKGVPALVDLQVEGGQENFLWEWGNESDAEDKEELNEWRIRGSSSIDAVLPAIKHLVHLRSLSLCRVHFRGLRYKGPVGGKLLRICRTFPGLQSLTFRECWGFSILDVVSLVKELGETGDNFSDLKTLLIYGGSAKDNPNPDRKAKAFIEARVECFVWDKLRNYHDHWIPSPDRWELSRETSHKGIITVPI